MFSIVGTYNFGQIPFDIPVNFLYNGLMRISILRQMVVIDILNNRSKHDMRLPVNTSVSRSAIWYYVKNILCYKSWSSVMFKKWIKKHFC